MLPLENKKIHFIGAGGTSMSGLMELSAYLGALVSGSDLNESRINELKAKGYDVYAGHNTDYAKKADITVYSGAIPTLDPELVNSKYSIERGQFLGYISKHFKRVVGIAGTHGKTTITALISHVLKKTKRNFTSHLGGEWQNSESGVVINGRDIFVTEACEYRDSFLALSPDVSIIINTEFDHPDYFGTYDRMIESYQKYADLTKEALITGSNVSKKVVCNNAHVRTYEYDKDIQMVFTSENECAFVLRCENEERAFFVPDLLADLAEDVALAAVALLRLGIDLDTSSEALADFKGIKRRMEYIGNYYDTPVYSDYAHHPTQIKFVIDACKKKYDEVIVVFQPHTYSRTKALSTEFANALSKADTIILLNVYGAREDFDEEGSSEIIFNKINASRKYLARDQSKIKDILGEMPNKSVLLFLGAGDIDNIAKSIIDGTN